MTAIDDAELVSIARLMLAVDARKASKAELERAFDCVVDTEDRIVLPLAYELLKGKRVYASFDVAEGEARARSLAAAVGGTVESVRVIDGATHITFAPPARERERYERERAAAARRAAFRVVGGGCGQ